MGLGDERFGGCVGRQPARSAYSGAIGRTDGARAFRAAVRHSRHVRILRIVVPLSVVAVVVGGTAFTMLAKPLRVFTGANVDVGSLVVSGTKIMMQQPRLAGFTRDNRRYDLIAQAAAQDLNKPDMVELHGINATMEMKDGSLSRRTAQYGLYNSKTEKLTLTQEYRRDLFQRVESLSERGRDRHSGRQNRLREIPSM